MPQRMQMVGRVCPTWADDLESIGYILMYFIAGGKRGLPWGAKATHKEISSIKTEEVLCAFCRALKGGPYDALADFLYYYLVVVRDRSVAMTRDRFHHLYHMLRGVMEAHGLEDDAAFDWMVQEEGLSAGSSSSVAGVPPLLLGRAPDLGMGVAPLPPHLRIPASETR